MIARYPTGIHWLAAAVLATGIPASLHATEPGLTPLSVKANNTLPLDEPASWLDGTVPDFATMAWWNGWVSGPSTTDLNTPQSWGGIRVTNPAGLVTINGPSLALNLVHEPCIDLSAARANLTINAPLAITGGSEWHVGSGRTLTVGAVQTSFGWGPLAKTGSGQLWIRGSMDLAGELVLTNGTVRTVPGASIAASRIELRTPDDFTPTSPVLVIGQSQHLPDLLVAPGLASATLELPRAGGVVRLNAVEVLSPLTIRANPQAYFGQEAILETGEIRGGVRPGVDALDFRSTLDPSMLGPETTWRPDGLQAGFAGGNVRFSTGLWAIRSTDPTNDAVIPTGSMLSIDARARLSWRGDGAGYVETFDGLAGTGIMIFAAVRPSRNRQAPSWPPSRPFCAPSVKSNFLAMLPYMIFPGNVGGPDALAEVVNKIKSMIR